MDPKFVANERVLCFEPDVKKMRVIYEASVLKVADKAPEQITISCPSHFKYLVHFRGWNSSWDRYVDEDCLLKDVPENRLFQQQLAREAEAIQLLAAKAKKRKKVTPSPKKTLSVSLPLSTSTENAENLPAGQSPAMSTSLSPSSERLRTTSENPSPPSKKKKRKKSQQDLINGSFAPIAKVILLNGASVTGSTAARPRVAPLRITTAPSQTCGRSGGLDQPTKVKFILRGASSPRKSGSEESSLDGGDGPFGSRQSVPSRKRRRSSLNDPPLTSTPVPPVTEAKHGDLKLKIKTQNGKSKATKIPSVLCATDVAERVEPPPKPPIAKKDVKCLAFELTDNLKHHLDTDHDFVTKKLRLSHLPAEPNIVTVLEDFVRNYAAERLLAYEKHQRKSLYTAYKSESAEVTFQAAVDAIQMCMEVADSLRTLVDFNLRHSLLYQCSNELHQYENAIVEGLRPVVPQESSIGNPCSDVEVAICNGIMSPADSPHQDPVITNGGLKSTRSAVRKSDSSQQSVASSIDLGSPREGCQSPFKNRQSVLLGRRGSYDNSSANNLPITSARSSTASNVDGSSCSATSRSTTTRTSLAMPPAATCPSTPQSNKVLRSIDEWRLVPLSEYNESPTLPSLIYGPIHLLRLFVRLPEILARMEIPPRTEKLIGKYIDSILEYFEAHPDLFSTDVYT